MRRRFVSDEERENIVRLRKSGAGWLRIETITGIPRRTAKRAFEESRQRQSEEEIQAARRQVAGDLFRSHVRDLVAIAGVVVASLSQPGLMDRRNGDTVLDNMLAINIRDLGISSQVMGEEQGDVTVRQNRMLFESLKQHTQSKIDWRILDDWRNARNEWQRGTEKLRSTSMTLMRNFVTHGSNKPGPTASINSDDKLIQRMIDGVVEVGYRAAVDGKPDDMEEYINTRERQGKVQVLFGGDVTITDHVVESKELADQVAILCRQVVTNLSKGKESEILKDMTRSLQSMGSVHDMLAEELDELKITPLILRTKCDICPA